MAYAIYSTTAAVPNLAYGLWKIGHTPTARLGVAYRLVRRNDIEDCARVDVRGLRPLGNALYLDRLLAGGIVGETLPIANQRICLEQDQLLGCCIDVVV
jgi:hypothetical protein